MPKLPTPSSPINKVLSGFADYLIRKRKVGSDNIDIGSVDAPFPGEEEGAGTAGTMADVMKKVDGTKFLLREWVPFGMTTMIVAEPGVGKSAFALYGLVRPLVSCVSWFNGTSGPQEPSDVLWCDTEGSGAITIQRIKDWSLPADRILVPFGDDPLKPINLMLQGHLDHLEMVINKYRTKLVVIDSLRGAHNGDENNSRVGQVLQKLGEIAERTKAAVVIIHHTRKLQADEDVSANSSRGSNAILALVRSQIGIDKPDKNSEWCRVQILKENLGLKPSPLGFRIHSTGIEFGVAPKRPRTSTELDEAEAWLREQLAPGKKYRASEIYDEAAKRGFAERTLRRAATERLGITPEAERMGGKITGHFWQLP